MEFNYQSNKKSLYILLLIRNVQNSQKDILQIFIIIIELAIENID